MRESTSGMSAGRRDNMYIKTILGDVFGCRVKCTCSMIPFPFLALSIPLLAVFFRRAWYVSTSDDYRWALASVVTKLITIRACEKRTAAVLAPLNHCESSPDGRA